MSSGGGPWCRRLWRRGPVPKRRCGNRSGRREDQFTRSMRHGTGGGRVFRTVEGTREGSVRNAKIRSFSESATRQETLDDPIADDRPHGHAPRGVEPLHDIRLVRPPEEPAGEPLVPGRPRELGHRALRVPAPGPGQSHRVRGRAQPRAAEDPPGDHHPRHLRAVRGLLHGLRAAVELPLGGAVHGGRGVFHLPGTDLAPAHPRHLRHLHGRPRRASPPSRATPSPAATPTSIRR